MMFVFTIIYTQYVLGRYGECNATLNHASAVVHNIQFGVFNTTLSKSHKWLPNHLQGNLRMKKKIF